MLRYLVAGLALTSAAFAQSNTNVQINDIVDALSVTTHSILPGILVQIGNHTANTQLTGGSLDDLITAFDNTTSVLNATAVSTGDNTTSPTNDDISVNFAGILSNTASTLSVITTDIVSNFSAYTAALDDSISATTLQLNETLPNSLGLVHDLMIDARQFFGKQNMSQTLVALGFPPTATSPQPSPPQ